MFEFKAALDRRGQNPIARHLPRPIFNELRRLKILFEFMRQFRGTFERSCPICSYSGLFDSEVDPPQYDARCPRCYSLSRHRLLKLWLDREASTFDLGRVLHFAPEPALGPLIRSCCSEYKSADIRAGRADLVVDIEEMNLSDECVDTFICLHILEHVNDHKALREIKRVLSPGGRAIIMAPIVEGWTETYENPAIVKDCDRQVHFGQIDHVRYYGADLRDRIRRAHLSLEEYTAIEPDVTKFGLSRGEKIFVARKF